MNFLNHVLAALSSSDGGAISADLSEVRLTAGQTVYEPAEEVQSIYFPGSAILSVLTLFPDGRSAEALTIGNESAAGIIHGLTGGQPHSRTFTQRSGQALKISAARLRDLTSLRPTLLLTMLASVQQDFSRAEHAVGCNTLHTSVERLARWLLMAQDRIGVGAPIFITQEALALVLGVQRTTVTSLASHLRDAGAITYVRGKIDILDRDVLEQTACPCYEMFAPEPRVAA